MQNNMKSLGMSADDTTLHLQHGALAHIVKQAMHAIRGIKMTTFTDWYWGHPNNANDDEHCLSLVFYNSQLAWHDRPCHSSSRFICKKGKLLFVLIK